MFSPTTSFLPYLQATATQRAQILHYLQARLQHHFPTLPERPFVRTLAEFRPTLLLTGTQVALSRLELIQLIQYLGNAPELPLLDPPLFGRPALELAQYLLHTNELTVSAIIELAVPALGRCCDAMPGNTHWPSKWCRPSAGTCPVAFDCQQASLAGDPRRVAKWWKTCSSNFSYWLTSQPSRDKQRGIPALAASREQEAYGAL
jgi:hypothetical protein